MKNKKYIVGLIKAQGERKTQGLLIYDFNKRIIEKRGYDNAREAYREGENIIGFKVSENNAYSNKTEEVITRRYIKLCMSGYNTALLPVIDENDTVIKRGNDVCVGSIGCGSSKQFIIVNYKAGVNLKTMEEIQNNSILGILKNYKNKSVHIITPCKNEFIDMKEYENTVENV